MNMTSVLPGESLTQTGPEGAAATLRPTSSIKRQLPMPLGSSHFCPPKTFLPHKILDKTSKNEGVSVQVEMERQVKVEVVKQVKVNCGVQEGCESSSSGGAASGPSDSGRSNFASSPALGKRLTRQLSSPSKAGFSALKLPATTSPLKDKSEVDSFGFVSEPTTVGVQFTIRKGISRQLPNADLVKRANQKESADSKGPNRSVVNEDLQALPRPTVFKSLENGKSTESGKAVLKTLNAISKPSKPAQSLVALKITKATVSTESSPVSSMLSSAVTPTLTRHPLRYGQPPESLTPKFERKSVLGGSFKRAKVESNCASSETKSQIPGVNQKLEPAKSVGKSPVKLSAIDRGLKKLENLRNILPKKKQGQGLLSAVTKGSTSSSRRTSNSSISCAGRGERAARKSSFHQSSQTTESDIKCGDVAEEIMSQQYAHQPDVVSNSLQHEAPPKRLHQLDAQYKDLGKWLRLSTSELKSRTTALVAMSIVVKHFSEQVDVLSKEISDLRPQLVTSRAKCDTLALQRDALISEIQGMKEDHEVEVNGMSVTHQMELHALQEKIKALVRDVEKRHLQSMASAQSESKQAIEELKLQHKKEMEAKDSELSQRTDDIELKYRQKIADLQRSQDSRFKEIKTQFETVKCALVDKIEHMNTECNTLRYQNQILVDGNPSALNVFGNSEAERQVETLAQEIESLKVVLELRNQEIGKLRAQNVIQDTQLQELTEAKQKIHQLKLKLENSEAIVHMKSDYERELAEKHTTLLRRYSKESKVNKQLSMNNEELMWKLEQVAFAPTASPNPIRRTHSGPSTKSATGTPLAARRSQPEMQWESFSSEGGGILPGTEDSDLDSAIME